MFPLDSSLWLGEALCAVCLTACSDERAGAHMSSERATGAGRARASVSRW